MIAPLKVEQVPMAAEFGPLFWAEGNLPGAFIPARFVGTWKRLIQSGGGAIIGQWKEDELVGILGCIFSEDINDGALVSNEAFWYVKQAHRGNGVRLFYAYESLARARGCKRIGMVHLVSLKAEKLSALYQRMGFVPTETHFHKEI